MTPAFRPAGDVVPDEDLEDARWGEPIQLRNLSKRAVPVRVERTGFELLCVGQAAMRDHGKFAPGDQFAALRGFGAGAPKCQRS